MGQKNKKELPVFPFKPDKVTETLSHVFECNEFETDVKVNDLMWLMFECPEREFYLFREQSEQLPIKLIKLRDSNLLLMNEVECFYYRHPKPYHNKDFVRVAPHNIEFDWEREVVQKGPEFRRIKLRLTEKAKRDLEISYRSYKEKQAIENPLELKPNFCGIGVDLIKTWGHINKWWKKRSGNLKG